jgi:hypothetical protein
MFAQMRSLNVEGLESGVALKEVFKAHSRPEFPENVLNGQSRPFEDGFTQHDVFTLLDVILPPDCHFSSLRELCIPCRISPELKLM